MSGIMSFHVSITFFYTRSTLKTKKILINVFMKIETNIALPN